MRPCTFLYFIYLCISSSSSFLQTCDRFLKEYDILNGSNIVEQHQTKLKKKLVLLQAEEESLQKGKHHERNFWKRDLAVKFKSNRPYQISVMHYGSISGMLHNDISLRDSILLLSLIHI